MASHMESTISGYLIRSVKVVAQVLSKSEFAVARHIDDYLKKDKLKPENRGSDRHLNGEQTRQRIERTSEQTYAHTHQIVTCIFER